MVLHLLAHSQRERNCTLGAFSLLSSRWGYPFLFESLKTSLFYFLIAVEGVCNIQRNISGASQPVQRRNRQEDFQRYRLQEVCTTRSTINRANGKWRIILFYFVLFGLLLESQCEMNIQHCRVGRYGKRWYLLWRIHAEIYLFANMFTLDVSVANRFEHRISQRVEGLC